MCRCFEGKAGKQQNKGDKKGTKTFHFNLRVYETIKP
jgi:hypothetical protein